MARIFVPQPIPDIAEERLRKCGEVTIYPHIDRQIPRRELLGLRRLVAYLCERMPTLFAKKSRLILSEKRVPGRIENGGGETRLMHQAVQVAVDGVGRRLRHRGRGRRGC